MGIHIHIHQHDDRDTKEKLNLIIQKLNDMGQNLDDIKQALADANTKADKIASDVQHLHDLISGTGETPTPEQWQEVKDAAAALNNKLQGIDDQTEDQQT